MKTENKESEPLNKTDFMRCCSNCSFYRHEEVGDSDYGAIYAKEATCSEYYDTDKETEEDIPNFDRDINRDCCELDFWKVVDLDRELSEKLSEDNGNIDGTYKLFYERYNNA